MAKKKKDEEFAKMMDMVVRMQLIYSIDESLKSIVDNFQNDIMEHFKTISLNDLQAIAELFDNLSKVLNKITENEEETNNGEV